MESLGSELVKIVWKKKGKHEVRQTSVWQTKEGKFLVQWNGELRTAERRNGLLVLEL